MSENRVGALKFMDFCPLNAPCHTGVILVSVNNQSVLHCPLHTQRLAQFALYPSIIHLLIDSLSQSLALLPSTHHHTDSVRQTLFLLLLWLFIHFGFTEHFAAHQKACNEASAEREACRREHADRDRDHALKCLERPPRPTYGYGHHGYGSHGFGYGYGRF